MANRTLELLKKFDAAHKRGPAKLSDVGLTLLKKRDHVWGDYTPKNSHIFAQTGGDSVHFCLLQISGKMTDESPVVMVVPCNSDAPRLVVGDTLKDFLALGSVIGFFFLEQLVYDLDRTLTYLFDYDAFLRHNYFGGTPPESDLDDLAANQKLLQDLSNKFGLAPWSDVREKLDALQKKWSAMIES